MEKDDALRLPLEGGSSEGRFVSLGRDTAATSPHGHHLYPGDVVLVGFMYGPHHARLWPARRLACLLLGCPWQAMTWHVTSPAHSPVAVTVSQAIDGLNTAGATKEAVINLISASPGWVEIAFINARSTDIAKKFLADLLPLMGTIAKSNPLVRCASMHFV